MAAIPSHAGRCHAIHAPQISKQHDTSPELMLIQHYHGAGGARRQQAQNCSGEGSIAQEQGFARCDSSLFGLAC